ncbi:MAG: glycosyltransferase, partial [Chloroflexota bacterium]
GAEGLDVQHGQHLLLADSPKDFADSTIRILQNQSLREKIIREGRNLVENVYDWRIIGEKLNRTIQLLAASK